MEKNSNKSLIIIGIAIIAVIILVFLFIKNNESNVSNSQKDSGLINIEKEEVINFELQNYDGDEISRNDFKSEIIVVNACVTGWALSA